MRQQESGEKSSQGCEPVPRNASSAFISLGVRSYCLALGSCDLATRVFAWAGLRVVLDDGDVGGRPFRIDRLLCTSMFRVAPNAKSQLARELAQTRVVSVFESRFLMIGTETRKPQSNYRVAHLPL